MPLPSEMIKQILKAPNNQDERSNEKSYSKETEVMSSSQYTNEMSMKQQLLHKFNETQPIINNINEDYGKNQKYMTIQSQNSSTRSKQKLKESASSKSQFKVLN